MSTITISKHARLRMAQRNVDYNDVAYVVRHGRRVHATGVLFHFLGKRNIPAKDRASKSRLEGTVVLTDCLGETVITVYRNVRSIKQIKQKTDWYRPMPTTGAPMELPAM